MTQSQPDMNKALFVNLISMLSMSTMQELGKLKNHFTGKTEVHLDMAQSTIDMLDMLEAKTRGNRDTDEDKLLKDTLSMLKLNYVETKEAEPQKTEPERSKAGDQEEEPRKSEIKDPEVREKKEKGTEKQENEEASKSTEFKQTGTDKSETKDPKFHKTYS